MAIKRWNDFLFISTTAIFQFTNARLFAISKYHMSVQLQNARMKASKSYFFK